MGEAATTPTFLDLLEIRHDAFISVEEAGAQQIRHEMGRLKAEALRTIRTGLEKIATQGRLESTASAVRRARGVVADVDNLVAGGFGTVDDTLLSLKEGAFRKGVSDFQIASASIPGGPPASLTASFTQVFPEAAEAALTNPVMGVSPTSTWKGVIAGTQENVQQTLLSAVLNGESIEDTMRVLADAMDITSASAERIARTGLNAMYNDAHKAVINANSDIFAGYRWLAALDDRTSAICIRLHGTFFPVGTNPPGPPAHWNCRSIVQPVFRDATVQAQSMTDTQRVKDYKADGTFEDDFIRTSTSSTSWLKRQPQWVQREVLGSKTKADLFRQGKATIEDIVSPAMEVLTDKAVVRRMAALRPKDKTLQALAKEFGVRVPSKKTIAGEDKALANKQAFAQPEPMPDPNEAP